MKCLLLFGGIGEVLVFVCWFGLVYFYSFVGLGKVFGDLVCWVWVGGYGGVEGLVVFIDEQGFDLLVDVIYFYVVWISQNVVCVV